MAFKQSSAIGGAVLPIYDEIFQQDQVEHILCGTSRAPATPPRAMRARPAKPGVVL